MKKLLCMLLPLLFLSCSSEEEINDLQNGLYSFSGSDYTVEIHVGSVGGSDGSIAVYSSDHIVYENKNVIHEVRPDGSRLWLYDGFALNYVQLSGSSFKASVENNISGINLPSTMVFKFGK